MACITEALGPVAADERDHPGAACRALSHRRGQRQGRGRHGQVARARRPSEILTESAFRNAQVVLQAIGGSTNGLIHLTAIADRTEHRIDLEAFDKLGREVPVLVDLKPSGDHYMEHFHHAGGVPQTDGAAWRPARSRRQDDHRRHACAMSSPQPRRCRARTSSARAPIRSSRKARWRCCTAISRRAAPSSSIRRRARDCCSTPAAPWCSNSVEDMTLRVDDPDARCHGRRRAGAAQRRAEGRAGHAGGRLSADPEEARARRRQGHGADLRCAHERHGLRHHRAAHHAGIRRRRAAGAGAETAT